jgi:hypothetical protein
MALDDRFAARGTIRVRKANDCGVGAARAMLFNGSRRSSVEETSAAKGRGLASLLALKGLTSIGVSPFFFSAVLRPLCAPLLNHLEHVVGGQFLTNRQVVFPHCLTAASECDGRIILSHTSRPLPGS